MKLYVVNTVLCTKKIIASRLIVHCRHVNNFIMCMDMNVIYIPFLSLDDRACLRNGAVNPGSPVPTYVAKRDNSLATERILPLFVRLLFCSLLGAFVPWTFGVGPLVLRLSSSSVSVCERVRACVHECPGSLGQGYFPCCNNDPRVMHLVSLSGSHLHLVIVPESKHFPPSLHPPPLFPKHLPSHLTHKYGRPTSRTLWGRAPSSFLGKGTFIIPCKQNPLHLHTPIP